MPNDLLDCVQSLLLLIEEESALLGQPGGYRRIGELATAKARVVAQLETRLAQSERETPGWQDRLDPEDRVALATASETLMDAARANAAVLARQIALSDELLAVIAQEAQRKTGATATAYGAGGVLWSTEQAAPIAINASL
ncbi:flagellar biosynthesis/type III secretory pathway chaperone [Sphingomonas sp. PvP055]|uniref:hypothetical protein n=1 Tax=Sphingomonas sp. PvP055 TaxID=3156391 RepID=UPI0033942A11